MFASQKKVLGSNQRDVMGKTRRIGMAIITLFEAFVTLIGYCILDRQLKRRTILFQKYSQTQTDP